MRVLIFEHVCGGGMAGEPLPDELAAQGAAMWSAVVEDFACAGTQVVTTLDDRLSLEAGDVHVTRVASSDQLRAVFDTLARDVDAALIIAPEFDGILEQWAHRLDALGVRSFGSPASAIRLCADKLMLASRLRADGVPTPNAEPADPWRDRPSEWIVKPRFGAGCEQTYVIDGGHGRPATSVLHSPDIDAIVQPYVRGRAASASFIVRDGGEIVPLLAGRQTITCCETEAGVRALVYGGGEVPASADESARAIALGRRAVAAVPGLRGFVGVDVVIGERPEDDVVIEINPRLTMSYVALRRLCELPPGSLAAAMLGDAAPIRWRPGRVAFDTAGRILSEQPA